MIYFQALPQILSYKLIFALVTLPLLFLRASVILNRKYNKNNNLKILKPETSIKNSLSENQLIKEINKHINDEINNDSNSISDSINQIFYLPEATHLLYKKCLQLICRKLNCYQSILYTCHNETEEINSIANYGLGESHSILIKYGQGQVGQVAITLETIILTNLPSYYSKIKSGLGESTPKLVIIIPILFRKQLQGIIEMSFLHQQENVLLQEIQKIAEVLGGHLFNIKVIDKQKKQVEQLMKQEEELKETQRKQEYAMQKVEKTLDKIRLEKIKNEIILEACQDGVISFNKSGKIEFCNKAASDILAISKENIINQTVQSLLQIEIVFNSYPQPYIKSLQNDIIIKEKTEITLYNLEKEEISVLATVAISEVESEIQFTMFLQKISVDLF